jgi:hypothetical protein
MGRLNTAEWLKKRRAAANARVQAMFVYYLRKRSLVEGDTDRRIAMANMIKRLDSERLDNKKA